MPLTDRSPIKRHLQRVIMLTSIVSLFLACAGFVVYDYLTFRRFMVDDLSTLARMLAVNVQSALVFDDSESAANTLISLRSRSSITSAAVYKLDHSLFATYVRPGRTAAFAPTPEKLSHRFEGRHLTVYATVVSNNKPIGVIFLESGLEKLYARFRTYLVSGLLLLLFSGVVAFFLSTRLQKTISKPIMDLAQTAKVVSESNDFSVRANKQGPREISLLGETFNRMLAHIQQRDKAVQLSNDALTELNQELEERVRQRTNALEQSNEQMQVFTYSVAHDLRAPLRSIKAFSEAVVEDYGPQLPGEGQIYLQRISKSADHMDTIIRDLLSYSYVSRDELNVATVNLRQVIDNALNFQTADIQAAKAEISIEEPIPGVIGHAATIENIITNLVSNGMKYVAPGTRPRINIRAETLGDKVRLGVEDNGIGIEPHHQEKIFGIFSRLHNSDTYSGTGIGLAIVRKGAERLNGRCGVESTPGNGSRFWIELPGLTATANRNLLAKTDSR